MRQRITGMKTSEIQRKLAEEALRERAEQTLRHQTALLELAKMDFSDLDSALKRITEMDSKTLDVERVSVWLFNEDHSEIIAEDLYKMSENIHERGLRLQAKQYPRYFQVLEESRTIAADDALSDPRTSEFTEEYLEPFEITSMMDVPVRLHGKVFGIVCHEHLGPRRKWTPEEQDFAASIADVVSLAFEASERKRAEEALQERERFLSSIFVSIQDGISILDNDMNIIRELISKPSIG
jgi:GAF domain-containing protein